MIERLLLFGTSGDLVGRHWLASGWHQRGI
jgi:hypothetical protein